jgi:hypothetical protein
MEEGSAVTTEDVPPAEAPEDGAIEVRPGTTPEDEKEVRLYDAASEEWSSWVEEREFLKRIRKQPNYKDTARRVREMGQAIDHGYVASPSPSPNIVQEDPLEQARRILELYRLLTDTPMPFDRMTVMTDPAVKRLVTLAERWKRDGLLIEVGKPRNLTFTTKALALIDQAEKELGKDSAETEEDPDTIMVRILEDVPSYSGPWGKVYKLTKEDVTMLPAPTARALVRAKKAVEIPTPAPAPQNVPTVTPGPSVPIVEKTPSKVGASFTIIPAQFDNAADRFGKLARKSKMPPKGAFDWNKPGSPLNYARDDDELLKHIASGGNYAILCGDPFGRIVGLDGDYEEIRTAIEKHLPPTLTVKTGRAEIGMHYIYRLKEADPTLKTKPLHRYKDGKKVRDENGKPINIGHIKYDGGHLVGAGSIHPDTGARYEVINNVPIAQITTFDIIDALADFLEPPSMAEKNHGPEDGPRSGEKDDFSWLDPLRIEDMFDMSKFHGSNEWLRSASPWHPTTHKTNIGLNKRENRAYCHSCDANISPLKALALNHGIITSCDEKLKGETWTKAEDIAVRDYGIERPGQPWKEALAQVEELAKPTISENEEEEGTQPKKKPKKPDLATIMMNMVKQDGQAVLFHDPIGNPYIQIWRRSHNEIRSLDDSFENFIAASYNKRTGKAAPSTAVKNALSNLASQAIENGEVHDLRIRVAHRVNEGGELEVLYDYGDKTWQAAKITKDGWEEVDNPPILFNRTQYTYPQVRPIRGRPGALTDLIDKQINIKNWQKPMIEIQFITDLLAINEQIGSVGKGGSGAGKSSKDKAEACLIDPKGKDDANILQNPKRDEDLELYLVQTYIAAVDNVSKVSEDRSDLLCTATTGGMRSKRAHHKNRQMINDRYRCAVRINGISNPLTREDALNRTIEYSFDQRPKVYKDKGEWWADFYELLPYALADLFDKAVLALKNYHENRWTGAKPRMGEWYCWAMAAAEAIGMTRAEFIALFKRFEAERNLTSVENDPLAPILMDIADAEDPFINTATVLLGLNEDVYDEHGDKREPRWVRGRAEQAGIRWDRDRTMPKDVGHFGMRLERLISTLDNVGYDLIKCTGREMLIRCPNYASDINKFGKDERLIFIRKRHEVTDGVPMDHSNKPAAQQQL